MISKISRDEMTPNGTLRILETTDLHMHILGYDYFADRPDHRIGLSVLADLIEAQRTKDGTPTLLFDNGDFLQGNPLADYVAETASGDRPHPMAAAMNVLGYDAVTLGNHDFDYGLPFLRRTINQIACPAVSANIRMTDGTSLAAPFVIIPLTIKCSDGRARRLTVGVTGFGPPQIADWTDGHCVQVEDIIDAAKAVVPQIKAAGADIVIALSHSGIGPEQPAPRIENVAVPLAEIAGVDVVLAGHTHEFFPDPARKASNTVDPVTGLLHQTPTVMAGCYGSALGVIDLDLAWTGAGWRIAGSHVTLAYPNQSGHPASAPRKQIEALVADQHNATLAHIRKPVAYLKVPVNSYFATVTPDLSQQLLAHAMRDKVKAVLVHDGPVLAAVSPFRCGGNAGRPHDIDAPAGLITRRDVAAIFPFADTLCAVRRTGLELRNWLERSAARYNRIAGGQQMQDLVDPLCAGYNCDAIYGLNYTFDLTGPARFGHDGHLINPEAQRVSSLTLNGIEVADSDTFVVAASSFRVRGGGGFPRVPRDDLLWMSDERVQDVLISALAGTGPLAGPPEDVWRFHHIPATCAQFESACGAVAYAAANIRHDGPSAEGRATFSLIF